MNAVIFAGGVGSRLWPLSRKNSPKQFMGLINDKTMLQLCYDRIHPVFNDANIYVASGKDNLDNIHRQLPHIDQSHLIGEPARKDLGPAVGLAAALIGKAHPQEPLAYIWGADQIYKNEDKYRSLFHTAQTYLTDDPDKIILLAETARFANQNVGWISFGNPVTMVNGMPFMSFESFRAKPDLQTAIEYYKDAKHAWNIGDFVTTPQKILSLYQEHAPEMFDVLMRIQAAYDTDAFLDTLDELYPFLDEVSLDNAIFEKMDPSHALVITADVGYADIGSWNTYKEAFENYPEDVVARGLSKVYDTTDSLIFNSQKDKLVVALDVDDLVIVNTEDVIFVGKKSSVHNIKKVVNDLKESEFADRM